MKTITKTYNVYSFDELNEQQQRKAIDKLWDINVNYEWWECTYDDAAQIGLIITAFNIDRASYVDGKLNCPMMESIYLIKKYHGECCDTYKLAIEYASQWDNLVYKYSDGIKTDQVHEDNIYNFDNEADELEKQYTKDLCECYLITLRYEYEYLTSDESIIDTIQRNNYEFTEDGEIA